MPDNGLYAVKMHGEKHAYELRGSEQHALLELSKTLSDITGYRDTYIRDSFSGMKIGEERKVYPAAIGTFGGPPYFVVKRVG